MVRVQGAAELAAGLARARQAIADDTEPATAVAGVIASHATPPVRTGYLAGSCITMPASARNLAERLNLTPRQVRQLTWDNPLRAIGQSDPID